MLQQVSGDFKYVYSQRSSTYYREMDNYSFREAFQDLSWERQRYYRVGSSSVERVNSSQTSPGFRSDIGWLHEKYLQNPRFIPGYPVTCDGDWRSSDTWAELPMIDNSGCLTALANFGVEHDF